MEYQQSELIKSLIDELTLKLPKLEGVYLFGSRAQKTATKLSDWDFGFLCREENKDAEPVRASRCFIGNLPEQFHDDWPFARQ